MSVARYAHTATLLQSGQVFVAGGRDISSVYLASSEIYTPACCCGSAKTVACGTAWSFDVPSVADLCSGYHTNPVVVSTLTNGICPQTITRTWLFTNDCGFSNTCSQTITVVSCVPPPTNMVAWWPGDGNGSDIIGGNNGTLMNGVTFAQGKVGQAFSFDGTNDYVEIPHSAAFNLLSGHTVDLWVKLDAYPVLGSYTPLVSKWVSGSEDKGLAIFPTGKISYYLFNTFGGVPLSSSTVLALGTWYHIAATYDGTTAKIYINGLMDASKPASGDVSDGIGKLYFGYNPDLFASGVSLSPFKGLADEIEWFNRALTTNEVAAIYNAGPAGKCKTPKLVCSPPKYVPCGTQISFDPPAVNDSCCVSNQAAIPFGSDLNGGTACAPTFTRTWLYVDCCGYSNFCSQTITVTNVPPVITCSTNKTIPCTSNLVFNPPTVVSPCCGTNYSISIFGSDVTTNLAAC